MFHGVRIIYFDVGMGNTVLRVKQSSLRYLHPLMCLLFLFFHTCLFGIQLSFQLVALYGHLPLLPLAYQSTLFNFVVNYCFEAEATPSTTVLPSEAVAKKRERCAVGVCR